MFLRRRCKTVKGARHAYWSLCESVRTSAGRGHAGGLAVEIIKRSDAARGFEFLPRRWGRTFGWLMKSRRLARDHERNPLHHEAIVCLAVIGHTARRPGETAAALCSRYA